MPERHVHLQWDGEPPEPPPFRGITAEAWGRTLTKAFAEGMRRNLPIMNRASLHLARLVAAGATAHADWYCSLPWYRRWWVMVRRG